MAFTLTVRNFRGLRHVEWSPSGVCALVGPNGSGKTTLIDVLQLLKDATRFSGFSKAIEEHGGAYGMRHFSAEAGEPISFEIQVGSIAWVFQPAAALGSGGAQFPVKERLSRHGVVFHDYDSTDETAQGRRPLLEDGIAAVALLQTKGQEGGPEMEAAVQIIEFVQQYTHYHHYTLARLRREGSRLGGDLRLKGDGSNLFTVLMNWRNRRDYRERWEFVTGVLRACFPEFFAELSFPIAANIVACEVHTPGDDNLIPSLLPDGFLIALLHLCAVASAGPGGVIAIDEPENALHPSAIRRLMDAFCEWSDAHGVTVLLATHSPVILDTFKEAPEKVFVMEPGHEVLPVPLDRIKGRDWLAHFSLGDLYEHLEYGAPKGVDEV
jgi:predicted ATPase